MRWATMQSCRREGSFHQSQWLLLLPGLECRGGVSALILAGESAEPRDANTARCDLSQAHDRPRMFAHIEYQVSVAHSPPSSSGADASRSCCTWDCMSEGRPTRTGCEADLRHMCQPLACCAVFSLRKQRAWLVM